MNIDEEIKSFKMRLLRKMPFYGDIVLRLGFYEKKDIPTACTDGRNIYYNTKFFEKLTEGQRNYVLMHEILHVILMHPSRGKGRNPKLWNVACDMVVNSMCNKLTYDFKRKAGIPFERPEEGIFSYVMDTDIVENIYSKLLDEYEKNKGSSKLVITLQSAVIRGVFKYRPEVKIDINESDDLVIKSYDSEAADNKSINSKETDNTDASDEIYIKEIIREAVEKARGSMGSYFIPEQVYELVASKTIKWQKLFKDLLQTDVGDDVSYTTPERKYIHMDLILPGHGPTEDKLEEIWAFVDSSGSVSGDEMSQFLTQLYRIAKEFGCVTNICYWDTEVTDTYLKIKSEKDILKCIPRHSGGTDINCVYNWIRDNKVKPDVMVILTDGYFGQLKTDAFNPKYKRKTVLVLSGNISISEDMKRIGKVTRLEN